MKAVKISAPCKLNLTLDILGRDGEYHQIDSLLTTVNLFDRIVARERQDCGLRVTMHGMGSERIPIEKNVAARSAELFFERFSTRGADLTIFKNVPIGGGLGGSSVDAAGTLEALAKLYEIDRKELFPLAEEIGSDVKALLTRGLMRMRGRGEIIEKLGTDLEFHFLLLVPRRGINTGLCYRKSDTLPPTEPTTEKALSAILNRDVISASKQFSNGLLPAASALEPEVRRSFEELMSFSPLKVNLTGSGSGVYAVFETQEECERAKRKCRLKYRAYSLKSIP